MKKGIALFSVLLIAGIIIASYLVSAQNDVAENVRTTTENIVETIKGFGQVIFGALLGGETTGVLLFIKFLFFMIILVIIWRVLWSVPVFAENTAVVAIISIAVSILATRFLTEIEWVRTILLPYNVLGVALLSFLPLLLYFYFVETMVQSHTMRQIAWILFAVIFFGLWLTRGPLYSAGASDIASGGLTSAATSEFNVAPLGNSSYIYLITAILSLLMAAFDKTIHARIIRSAIEKKGRELDTLRITDLQEKIQQWKDVIGSSSSTPEQIATAKRSIHELDRRIAALLKH